MKITKKSLLVLPAAAMVAVSVGACGSTMAKDTGTTATATPAAATVHHHAAKPKPKPAPLTGPVGTPYTATDMDNNKMAVKLTKVMDPAKPADSYLGPDNGKRFVGAKFEIKGVSGTFDDDANSDAVAVGADGQTYQADFDDIAGCTNFNSGEFNVSPGQSSVGCVVFQVPNHVKVKSIQWGEMFSDSAPATWTL